MISQKQTIEKWLHDKGSITGKECMEQLGCYRLSARILEIRREQLERNSEFYIATTYLSIINPYSGKASRPAKYILKTRGEIK